MGSPTASITHTVVEGGSGDRAVRALQCPPRERSEAELTQESRVDAAGDLLQRFHLLLRQHVEYEAPYLAQVNRTGLHHLPLPPVGQRGMCDVTLVLPSPANPAPFLESRDHVTAARY